MIDKDIEISQENMIKILNKKNQLSKQLEFDFPTEGFNTEVCQVAGATCLTCQEYYPYAELKKDFKCWSCKNF